MRSHGFILRVKVPEGLPAEEFKRYLTDVAVKTGADLSLTIREEHIGHAMHVSRKTLVRSGERI